MSTTEAYCLASFEHPLLDCQALLTQLDTPLGEQISSTALVELLSASSSDSQSRDADTKPAIRRLLRVGGFKPSGRNKPASEYLVQAIEKGRLGSINPVVDVINVASHQGGIPISVLDYDRLIGLPRLVMGGIGESYVFNASGQLIDVSGLLCLADDEGPCANGVKDSQRTKTCAATRRILTILWGTKELPGRTAQVASQYRQLIDNFVA